MKNTCPSPASIEPSPFVSATSNCRSHFCFCSAVSVPLYIPPLELFEPKMPERLIAPLLCSAEQRLLLLRARAIAPPTNRLYSRTYRRV